MAKGVEIKCLASTAATSRRCRKTAGRRPRRCIPDGGRDGGKHRFGPTSVSFDEFSFTVVLAYNGRRGLAIQAAARSPLGSLEYMRFTWEQGVFMFVVSPEDRGQAGHVPAGFSSYEDTDGMRAFFYEWGPTLPSHAPGNRTAPPSKWPFSTPRRQALGGWSDRRWHVI